MVKVIEVDEYQKYDNCALAQCFAEVYEIAADGSETLVKTVNTPSLAKTAIKNLNKKNPNAKYVRGSKVNRHAYVARMTGQSIADVDFS